MRDPEMRTFDILGTSLLFWEVLTFLALLSAGWLLLSILRGQNDGETTREEYLTTRDDITRNSNA